MASDLSSGCIDDIEKFDEKEEGEISLEDVSSSEESHPNYRSGFRPSGRCSVCAAAQQCASWCIDARALRKTHRKRDAAHGKENRRHVKDSSSAISKNVVSTLQEKNDDLVPISSDSDMEIVGLPGNSKQASMRVSPKNGKLRKKKKKKRSHSSLVRVEDLSSPTEVETYLIEVPLEKTVRASKSHHGEPSSPRYSVRSPIERPLPRSPSRRYRTRPLRSRSPLRRSRSPLSRVAPALRKSPRKLRSPRRSPVRSGTKSSLPSREHSAPSSQTHIDLKLLKKVRQLERIGAGSPKNKLSRSKEHLSLKEKLSNMLKKTEQSDENLASGNCEKTNSVNENNNTEAAGVASGESIDDDEDIELLRRLALETKQKRAEMKNEETTKVRIESNADVNFNDDNDNEAYELRLIALRSAIMKNHENRVKRGVKPKRRKKSRGRVESPFGKSFLDEIPTPDDDDSILASLNATCLENDDEAESNRSEDMDLDTDVEREKEKDSMLPYSPTDDLTREIAVGDEFPSNEIQDGNNEFSHCKNSVERQNSFEASQYVVGYDTPYSPSATIAEKLSDVLNDKETPCSPYVSDYEAGIDTPYSPPSPIKSMITEILEKTTNCIKTPCESDVSDYEPGIDTPYSPSRPIEIPKIDNSSTKINSVITDIPYSPTDTPICDIALSPGLAETASLPDDVNNRTVKDSEFKNSSVVHNLASSMLDPTIEQEKNVARSEQTEVFVSKSLENEYACLLYNNVSLLSTRENCNKIIETIRSIDELPEVDLDGSPLVPLSKDHEAGEIVIPLEISPERVEQASEPLYLQGLPDVTKDTNKIPTLVNRTLVPALILKTNKNLQQPLPQKKLDNQAEPSFKSAEMLPVSVENAPVKSSALFKPIKLCPVSKKPQVLITTASAFNASFGDDSIRETKSDEELVENIPMAIKAKSPTPGKSDKSDEDSSRKQRRRLQQRSNKRRRKSSSGRPDSLSFVNERSTKSESNSIGSSSTQKKSKISDTSKNRSTRNSSISSASRLSSNNKEVPSRRSKSGQLKTPSSKNDRAAVIKKQAKGSPEPSPRRSARKLRRERRLARKADASQDETIKDTKESSPSKETSSGDTKVKASTAKSNEQVMKETSDKNKNEEISIKLAEQTADETEKKRRCSLDDDEEALRALLLASLPKRQKPVQVPSPPANQIPKVPQLSDTTTDTSAENSASKVSKEPTASLSDEVFTPLNPPVLSSQSSSASSAKTETSRALPKKIEAARKILASESSSVESSSPRKRVNSVPPKGPPKKIVKKALPVIASTKVVNNAKKYQNAMLQKKLSLQRAASIYSAQNGSRNITLNNLKINEAARPTSPKITTASKMQRLIINLGSDTDTESEQESQTASLTSGDTTAEMRKPLAIPTTDFEKSVEQFLRDQRKKHDSVNVVKTAVTAVATTSKSPATGKLDGICNTPLAVRRHLPMSQQEEYRRLKQQILERERQKLQKTVENTSISQNRNSRSPCTPPGPLSPASPIAATLKIDNHKVSSVASQVTTSQPINPAIVSSRDNTNETNLTSQQKINLPKTNENKTTANVTKLPNKTLINPAKIATLCKLNSINHIVHKSTPNAPVKLGTKVNTIVPNVPKTLTDTSTPKVPAKTAKLSSNISSTKLTSLQISKNTVVATTRVRRNSGIPEVPSVTINTAVESSTNVSSIVKDRRNSGIISIPSTSTMRTSSAPSNIRSSLNPTEMLTIQIPNDKVRNVGISENSRSESNSPSGRSVGMLRVLTKEQLNNRFVQIQIERGPTGRKVTVGSSPSSPVDFAHSSNLTDVSEPSDKTNLFMCCDNSVIVNETDSRRIESSNEPAKSDDTTLVNSDASTLIISGNEGSFRNDSNFDSTASTFVMVYPNSESNDNLENTRTEERTMLMKATGVKTNKNQSKGVWDKIKADVKNELEVLVELPIAEQERLLVESQENLVAKRHLVLEELTELSGCLRQWEVDREIQTKLVAEVRHLREQLREAEERLQEQRRQMNGMGPKVTKSHEKINQGRRECYKLSRICQGLGIKIIGEDYKYDISDFTALHNIDIRNKKQILVIKIMPKNKVDFLAISNDPGIWVPNTGAQLLNERLKEVAVHTRQLSKKKIPNLNSSNENTMNCSVETVTLSDSSIERPSNTDFDDNRETRENSVYSETSNVTAIEFGENTEALIAVKSNVVDKENDDSSSCEVISLMRETEDSNSTELLFRDKDTSNKENNHEEENGTTRNETIISSTEKTLATESIEYISLPETSESGSQQNNGLKIDRYNSVLTHLKIPRNDNPDGILCPYELMGTCNDGDCQFYHLDPNHSQ